MAHNAKISSLTDELIQSILNFDPATNKQALRHAKELASRGLRAHQYARTNQFDVASAFAGLDEKFRIKNRTDLADALQTRLKRIQSIPNKFQPEQLAFLLHLSDRPLENTRLDALDLIRPPDSPPLLTWAEILEADPYSDEEIWKDVDYATDTSDTPKTPKKRDKPIARDRTFDEEDVHDLERCTLTAENELLDSSRLGQFWRGQEDHDGTSGIAVTELQAVRETLFMLSGQQTKLYVLDTQNTSISLNPVYRLGDGTSKSMIDLLADFTVIGNDLLYLRSWTGQDYSVPLVQRFQASIRSCLLTYQLSLAQHQTRFSRPETPTTVSLLELHDDFRSLSSPLLHLVGLVRKVESGLLSDPFVHIEALYDETVLAQLTLDSSMFHFWSKLFFACLQLYIRPIRTWMESGDLGLNSDTFFVYESDADGDMTSLWHDRYMLRQDANGKLQAPTFIHPATQKIFNTGKSIVFLRELGITRGIAKSSELEPSLDHESVCGSDDDVPLLPFPELFEAAFDNWMQSKYSQASTILRRHIFERYHLLETLDMFHTVYLGQHGAASENFAIALFHRMDGKRKGWNDRYALTELLRETFDGLVPAHLLEKIMVRPAKAKNTGKHLDGLKSIMIDIALPWPIQNIIQRASMTTHQQVYTFLLQIYRVRYLLQQGRHAQFQGRSQPHALKLLHKFIWFTDILRSHLTETVVYFTMQETSVAMEKAEDIEKMAHIHLQHTEDLKKKAMLSDQLKPIYQTIKELLELGVSLSRSLQKDTPYVSRKQSSQKGKETATSDSDEDNDDMNDSPVKQSAKSPNLSLGKIDRELQRLLPFVTAGLLSVGRAAAEPMWEQLSERLSWDKTRDTPS